MKTPFRKLSARVYDSAVAWTFVFTLIRTGGNLLVLPLMLNKLPQADLGFWYSFLSISGISSLVDMGFYPTMSRVTAFLWAGATEVPRKGVAVIPDKESRATKPNYRLLADLVKTMRLYYLGLGGVITLVMGLIGTFWVWERAHLAADARIILFAWFLFLPGLFINTTSGMWHPLLSGINRVREGQQVFVWGLMVNYIVIFAGLLLGAGLFAPVAGYLAMGVVSRFSARVKFNHFSQARDHKITARWSPDLLANLWPMAWRTGVVTLGIYATLNLGVLICTTLLGPTMTASYGLSLQLASAAVSVSTAFIAVKTPLIAQLRARGLLEEIAAIVTSRMRFFYATFIFLALLILFLGAPVLRELFHSRTPLLSPPLLAALLAVVGLEGHHAVFRELTLTAHENPFAKPVVIAGAASVVLMWLTVRWVGVWGLILAPGVVQLCFNNWWTVLVGLRSINLAPGKYLGRLLSSRPTADQL